MMRRNVLAGLVALVLTVACGDDTTIAPPPPVEIDVVNYLAADVTLSAAGVTLGTMPGAPLATAPSGATVELVNGLRTMHYTTIPFRYGDGSDVLSDFPGETITVPEGGGTLTLNNVVGAQPYFAFDLLNTGKETISVAVVKASGMACLGTLPDLHAQWYGYYALTPASEVRVYHNTDCTGAYRYWPNATVSQYDANAGTLRLQVFSDAAP